MENWPQSNALLHLSIFRESDIWLLHLCSKVDKEWILTEVSTLREIDNGYPIHVLMGISLGYIPQHGQALLIHATLPRVRLVGRVLPSHDTIDSERYGLAY